MNMHVFFVWRNRPSTHEDHDNSIGLHECFSLLDLPVKRPAAIRQSFSRPWHCSNLSVVVLVNRSNQQLTVVEAASTRLQRMLLLSYDKAKKRIQLRHYSISAQPSGVSKSVKALVTQRAVPDMGQVQDVSEFLSRSGYGSVSLLLLPRAKPSCCSSFMPSLGTGLSWSHYEPCQALCIHWGVRCSQQSYA